MHMQNNIRITTSKKSKIETSLLWSNELIKMRAILLVSCCLSIMFCWNDVYIKNNPKIKISLIEVWSQLLCFYLWIICSFSWFMLALYKLLPKKTMQSNISKRKKVGTNNLVRNSARNFIFFKHDYFFIIE